MQMIRRSVNYLLESGGRNYSNGREKTPKVGENYAGFGVVRKFVFSRRWTKRFLVFIKMTTRLNQLCYFFYYVWHLWPLRRAKSDTLNKSITIPLSNNPKLRQKVNLKKLSRRVSICCPDNRTRDGDVGGELMIKPPSPNVDLNW